MDPETEPSTAPREPSARPKAADKENDWEEHHFSLPENEWDQVLSDSPDSASGASPKEANFDELELELQDSDQMGRKRSHKELRTTSSASLKHHKVSAPQLYKPPTWMRRLLTSKLFVIGNCFFIILNMMWTGFYANSLVTEHAASPASSTTAYFVIESMFSGCFLAELIVRLLHFASFRLWYDPWLCIDIVVITIPAVELWILRPLGWGAGTTSVTVVNIFRVFRVSRGVALLASINWFRPMYLAAVGFKHSVSSLFVAGIYLGTLLFTTSLVICNSLGPSSPNYLGAPEIVRARFRSVGETVLTLSECLLGGLEWGPELVDVLLFKDMVFAGAVLFGFLILGSLLWLNIVAGIFMQQVDRSFEVTSVRQFTDPDFVNATKEILRDFVEDLRDLDEENNESLNWRQNLDGKKLKISLVVTNHLEMLSDLGIRMPQAKRIFGELDMNNTGYVSISMFMQRLIENLKYKTLETLIFENQQSRLLHLMKKLARLNIRSSKKVMDQMKGMSESIAQVESEEPLQSAVQRRLARQKQRVVSDSRLEHCSGMEREQFNEVMVDVDVDLPPTISAASVTSGASGSGMDGHSCVIECWKRSLEGQRRNIRLLVNRNIAPM